MEPGSALRMAAGLQIVYESTVVVGAEGFHREGNEAVRQDLADGLQNKWCLPPG